MTIFMNPKKFLKSLPFFYCSSLFCPINVSKLIWWFPGFQKCSFWANSGTLDASFPTLDFQLEIDHFPSVFSIKWQFMTRKWLAVTKIGMWPQKHLSTVQDTPANTVVTFRDPLRHPPARPQDLANFPFSDILLMGAKIPVGSRENFSRANQQADFALVKFKL